jgi:hypothetical protein
MTVLFRAMRDDGEGKPECGPSARTLGVRPDGDIAIGADGMVAPETGGMSVALETPLNLPPHRRPPTLGGWGRDPVWQVEENELPSVLLCRPDPKDPLRHGFVEPIEAMSLDDFQEALATSRGFWSRT